jgi:hypothetical protein
MDGDGIKKDDRKIMGGRDGSRGERSERREVRNTLPSLPAQQP